MTLLVIDPLLLHSYASPLRIRLIGQVADYDCRTGTLHITRASIFPGLKLVPLRVEVTPIVDCLDASALSVGHIVDLAVFYDGVHALAFEYTPFNPQCILNAEAQKTLTNISTLSSLN